MDEPGHPTPNARQIATLSQSSTPCIDGVAFEVPPSSNPSNPSTPSPRKRSTTTDLARTPIRKIQESRRTPSRRRKKELLLPPPDAKQYSPPSRLRDSFAPNLILVLVGVNPGLLTGSTGFAYSHPSNLFWKLLHSSGITDLRHPPSDTYRLPELYSIGNTNIVERPTRDASMLSKAEMDAGVPILERKIAAHRPDAVALVGKGIWESVWRVRHGRAIKKEEFRYGWQDEAENMGRDAEHWIGARVFVATTTSGLAATMSMAEKQKVWNELGSWVKQRRAERSLLTPTVQ